MPLYFAYGANLDQDAMAQRCPASTVVTAGRLANHRFFIMADGYASVRREEGASVHGLLWMLAHADIAALDRFEDVGNGLYSRITLPVLKNVGASRALVYVGRSQVVGAPKPGYMDAVIRHAERCGLPATYRRELQRWLPHPSTQGAEGMKIRPRFATPLDR